MEVPGTVYQGYPIRRDVFHYWIVFTDRGENRFHTKKAARAFVDRMIADKAQVSGQPDAGEREKGEDDGPNPTASQR